jgi:osmotically-inducible protein OsmY
LLPPWRWRTASVVSNDEGEHDGSRCREIRCEILDRLSQQSWTDFGDRNIIVTKGVVDVWGLVGSDSESKALTALAEGVPGVKSVSDEMIPAYS